MGKVRCRGGPRILPLLSSLGAFLGWGWGEEVHPQFTPQLCLGSEEQPGVSRLDPASCLSGSHLTWSQSRPRTCPCLPPSPSPPRCVADLCPALGRPRDTWAMKLSVPLPFTLEHSTQSHTQHTSQTLPACSQSDTQSHAHTFTLPNSTHTAYTHVPSFSRGLRLPGLGPLLEAAHRPAEALTWSAAGPASWVPLGPGCGELEPGVGRGGEECV